MYNMYRCSLSIYVHIFIRKIRKERFTRCVTILLLYTSTIKCFELLFVRERVRINVLFMYVCGFERAFMFGIIKQTLNAFIIQMNRLPIQMRAHTLTQKCMNETLYG